MARVPHKVKFYNTKPQDMLMVAGMLEVGPFIELQKGLLFLGVVLLCVLQIFHGGVFFVSTALLILLLLVIKGPDPSPP